MRSGTEGKNPVNMREIEMTTTFGSNNGINWYHDMIASLIQYKTLIIPMIVFRKILFIIDPDG